MTSENNALMREAEWLETALTNSANKGYNVEFRKGFAAAVGWVRLHAENPDEIGSLHPHADDCAFLVSVELHCTCGAAVENDAAGAWLVYDYDQGPYAISLHESSAVAARKAARQGYGKVGFWPFDLELNTAVDQWEGRTIPPEGTQP